MDVAPFDNGIAKYASFIIENLKENNYLHYLTKHRSVSPKKALGKTVKINTYTSTRDVITKTVFILPFHLIYCAWQIMTNGLEGIYFTHFTHWNIFFASVFRLFGKKVIYTVHDGQMHLGEKRTITQWEMNFLIRVSTDLIFLSKAVKNEVSSLIGRQRCHIIPIGLLAVDGVTELTEVKAIPSLLLFGRISKYKGVELLCEAMEQMPSEIYSKLVIAGKANYNLRIPQNDKIVWHDRWLSDEEIAGYINESDIMVFPYLEATQSGALTLAFQGLRPILCTNVGGLTEQLADDEGVIVYPTVEALRAGLQKLIENTDLRRQLILKMKAKKEALVWGKISQSIEEVLQAGI
jgi:glycosyltransferase involved in cell wall biosynthesis